MININNIFNLHIIFGAFIGAIITETFRVAIDNAIIDDEIGVMFLIMAISCTIAIGALCGHYSAIIVFGTAEQRQRLLFNVIKEYISRFMGITFGLSNDKNSYNKSDNIKPLRKPIIRSIDTEINPKTYHTISDNSMQPNDIIYRLLSSDMSRPLSVNRSQPIKPPKIRKIN